MHTVKILNFDDNESVPHSFALIKGCVVNHRESTCHETKDTVTLKTTTNKILHSQLTEQNLFKFLVDLKNGLNTLTVTYCCTSVTFTLDHAEQNTSFTVAPLYVICASHDGRFQAPENENNSTESACKRILTGAKLLQCILAEKLFEQKLGRKTFKLEKNCQVFKSKLHYDLARRMEQKELWFHLAKEIINSTVWDERKKIFAFLSCTLYQNEYKNETLLHEDILKQTKAHVALATGGFALLGTGCLYTWPEDITEIIPRFLNNNPVNTASFMDDSCYRSTLGSCFSTTLGAALHELCHTFDLGHTEKGIMGRGFDDIHKVFTVNATGNKKPHYKPYVNFEDDCTNWTKSCAVLLRYHKWINGLPENKRFNLKFDLNTRSVKSTAGIRVIEIRRESDEMVLHSWVFISKVLKFSFQIPQEVFNEEGVVVVIEDAAGNIIKKYYPVIS